MSQLTTRTSMDFLMKIRDWEKPGWNVQYFFVHTTLYHWKFTSTLHTEKPVYSEFQGTIEKTSL